MKRIEASIEIDFKKFIAFLLLIVVIILTAVTIVNRFKEEKADIQREAFTETLIEVFNDFEVQNIRTNIEYTYKLNGNVIEKNEIEKEVTKIAGDEDFSIIIGFHYDLDELGNVEIKFAEFKYVNHEHNYAVYYQLCKTDIFGQTQKVNVGVTVNEFFDKLYALNAYDLLEIYNIIGL